MSKCPVCGWEEQFDGFNRPKGGSSRDGRYYSGRPFNMFGKDPKTGELFHATIKFPCGHEAWINKELRDKYGKPEDPVLEAEITTGGK